MENIKKFYDALSNDKAMQDRAAALNKQGEKPDESAAKVAIVAFAKAEGYSFTEADLDAYGKQAKPLADEALDAAAGGDAGCGCVVAGGGGGTDSNGNTFACACVAAGMGDSKDPGGGCVPGACVCAGVGAGAAT